MSIETFGQPLTTEDMLMTDWGVIPAPAELVAAWNAAPKRVNGWPDRRTRAGREALRVAAETKREFERRFTEGAAQ